MGNCATGKCTVQKIILEFTLIGVIGMDTQKMFITRQFKYYLKCHDGRLLYAEGPSVQEAAKAAGVSLSDIKRHMPVKSILTEAEKAEQAKKFKALKEKKAKERSK